MEEPVSVTRGEDGAIVAHAKFPKCLCEPDVSYQPGDAATEYRCGCKNELIVGPGAAGLVSPADTGTVGSDTLTTPDGEAVEVAWRLRPQKPPRKRAESAA